VHVLVVSSLSPGRGTGGERGCKEAEGEGEGEKTRVVAGATGEAVKSRVKIFWESGIFWKRIL
jgi:hypothetical protein